MATLYAINAGGNWNAGATWSTTATKDGTRTGGVSVPTISDACIIDDYSGSVTVDSSACVCASLNMTGHTGTFTCASPNKLAVCGNITLAAGTTYTCTGELTIGNSTTTSTITSAGKTWGGTLVFAGTGIKTLAAALTVTGSLTVTGACECAGNFALTCGGYTGSAAFNRSANVLAVVSGTVTSTAAFTGTMTLATGAIEIGNLTLGVATLSAASGTIITTVDTTLTLTANATITAVAGGGAGSISWKNVSTTGSPTVVWTNATYIALDLTVLSGAATFNTGTIRLGGDLALIGSLAGTSVITMDDGMWYATGAAGILSNSLTFISSGTIGGSVYYQTGTLTGYAGVIATDSTLNIVGACTLHVHDFPLNNVAVTGTTTVTITEAVSMTGAFSVAGATTITGTFPITTSGGYTDAGTGSLTLTTGTLAITGGSVSAAGGITGLVTMANTITLGNIKLGAASKLTCATGAITVTPATTLTIASAAEVDVVQGLITWQNVSHLASGTLTWTKPTVIAGNIAVSNGAAAVWTSTNATKSVWHGGTITLTGTGTLNGSSVLTALSGGGGLSLTIT